MLFVGGTCTQGPGMVVSVDLKEPIRSHYDIEKKKAKFMKNAINYYEGLSARACNNGHAIDIYSATPNQTGLTEMKSACNMTGGHLLLCDSFRSSLFQQSFLKVFAEDCQRNLKMAFNATFEVKTWTDLKVCGIIGPCASMKIKSPNVSKTEVGISGTSQWKFCALDPNTTPAVYFQVASQQTTPLPQGSCGYIQFITQYQHSSGFKRIRVTTIARCRADATTNLPYISAGFDQEALAVLMARSAVNLVESRAEPNAVYWLDHRLVGCIF